MRLCRHFKYPKEIIQSFHECHNCDINTATVCNYHLKHGVRVSVELEDITVLEEKLMQTIPNSKEKIIVSIDFYNGYTCEE